MKGQFAVIEGFACLTLALLAVSWEAAQVNSATSGLYQSLQSLRQNAAVYDISGQVLSNQSVQTCVLSANDTCIAHYLSVYKVVFHAKNIGIISDGLKVGNFTTAATKSCFGIGKNLTFETVCVFVGA